MPSPAERERDVVALEREGLKITVTQRVATDVVESPLGGCVYGSLQPLKVSVETATSRVVHALQQPEAGQEESGS